jgi:hypothetical protein
MNKLYIKDTLFSHAYSSSWYNKPTNFEWSNDDDGDYIILTDDMIFSVDKYKNKNVYAWLIESPVIKPISYDFILNNYHKFYKIFTFDKRLLEISDKSILIPIGGCWINEHDRLVHNKNKILSIISSSKRNSLGHKLRHDTIAAFSEDYDIDVFGSGYKFIENKIDALKEYKFSIVIENCQSDYYFTEKLIDCFQTGTIPIYWGCPSINKFFKLDNRLIFNNLHELEIILDNIKNNKLIYEDFLNDVLYNYSESKKYLIADDIIFNFFNDEKISY